MTTIKICWNCEYPFALGHVHKATGYEVLVCANPRCNAPWDVDDEQGLRIMRSEAPVYAKKWEAVKANWVAV